MFTVDSFDIENKLSCVLEKRRNVATSQRRNVSSILQYSRARNNITTYYRRTRKHNKLSYQHSSL
jgi:hypothetical protein